MVDLRDVPDDLYAEDHPAQQDVLEVLRGSVIHSMPEKARTRARIAFDEKPVEELKLGDLERWYKERRPERLINHMFNKHCLSRDFL